MNFCPNCGTRLQQGWKACPKCGTNLIMFYRAHHAQKLQAAKAKLERAKKLEELKDQKEIADLEKEISKQRAIAHAISSTVQSDLAPHETELVDRSKLKKIAKVIGWVIVLGFIAYALNGLFG